MKTKPRRQLWGAFALALLAVLGTLALFALAWLRHRFWQQGVIAFNAPIWVLNTALNEPDFQGAVRWILGFNALSILCALWLVLRQ